MSDRMAGGRRRSLGQDRHFTGEIAWTVFKQNPFFVTRRIDYLHLPRNDDEAVDRLITSMVKAFARLIDLDSTTLLRDFDLAGLELRESNRLPFDVRLADDRLVHPLSLSQKGGKSENERGGES